MKLNKSILAAAALTLGMAGVSEAGTVYLTGSSAARSAVYAALNSVGVVFNAAPAVTTYDGTAGSPNGANYMAFVGTDTFGNPLTVQCHWSGSEAGVKDVATGQSENFIQASLLNTTAGTVQDNGSAQPASFDAASANVAMADNAQAYSRTTSPLVQSNAAVGVITFKWIRNPGLWTGTNVSSSQIIQALSGVGYRSIFDGDPSHVNDFVYVSGRNAFSGTRVNAYGDCGFGILSTPYQIEINGTTGDMVSDTDLNGTPGVYFGDIGFESGGTLCKTMGASTVGKTDLANGGTGGFSVIAYASVGDAQKGIDLGAKELSYNGVWFSRNAVIEGAYSFWGNEYILGANGISGQAKNVYSALIPGIPTAAGHSSTGFIPFSDMNCARSGPTGAIGHN